MNNRKLLFFLFVIIFLASIIVFAKPFSKTSKKSIADFEQCAQAGYAVMESYPRQCTTPQGKTFVEKFVSERARPK